MRGYLGLWLFLEVVERRRARRRARRRREALWELTVDLADLDRELRGAA